MSGCDLRRSIEAFDFLGSWLFLYFVNTVEPRVGPDPVEFAPNFSAIVGFLARTSALDDATLRRLATSGVAEPRDAHQVWRRALDLREALRGPVRARPPAAGDSARSRRPRP